MSHMRVIVTGANGFIGKRLVETPVPCVGCGRG